MITYLFITIIILLIIFKSPLEDFIYRRKGRKLYQQEEELLTELIDDIYNAILSTYEEPNYYYLDMIETINVIGIYKRNWDKKEDSRSCTFVSYLSCVIPSKTMLRADFFELDKVTKYKTLLEAACHGRSANIKEDITDCNITEDIFEQIKDKLLL